MLKRVWQMQRFREEGDEVRAMGKQQSAAHWIDCELWETRRRGQEGGYKYEEETLAGSCINTSVVRNEREQ